MDLGQGAEGTFLQNKFRVPYPMAFVGFAVRFHFQVWLVAGQITIRPNRTQSDLIQVDPTGSGRKTGGGCSKSRVIQVEGCHKGA